jgi:hypothetical protein
MHVDGHYIANHRGYLMDKNIRSRYMMRHLVHHHHHYFVFVVFRLNKLLFFFGISHILAKW